MKAAQIMAAAVALAAGPAMAQTLTGGEWQVQTLVGTHFPAGVTPTIAFADGGRVSGHSGCNRYMGGWAQDGAMLTFTPLAGTRMACDAARMEVEARMLAALGAVRQLALTPGGALELLGEAGLLIRAVRP